MISFCLSFAVDKSEWSYVKKVLSEGRLEKVN